VNHERRVLMGLRAGWKSAYPDHWDTIGGHVEANETLEAALVREITEEVGVTPTEFHRIGSFDERRPDLYGRAVHHIFKVLTWVGGDPRNVCDEHSEIRWFAADELAGLSNLVDYDYPRLAKLAVD